MTRHRYQYPDGPRTPAAGCALMDAMNVLPPGLTYRQIDHWIHSYPLLFSESVVRRRGAGSGVSRRFTAMDLHILTMMHHLVDAGIALSAAARFAGAGQLSGDLSEWVSVRIRKQPYRRRRPVDPPA